jgi:hypothetical protein
MITIAPAVRTTSLAEQLLTSFHADHPYLEWGAPNEDGHRWLYWNEEDGRYWAGVLPRARDPSRKTERSFESFEAALAWVLPL